jgi:hypothetical protein
MKRTFMKTKPEKMQQVALRLKRAVVLKADRLGARVRGGRSEVLRRAIDEGIGKGLPR